MPELKRWAMIVEPYDLKIEYIQEGDFRSRNWSQNIGRQKNIIYVAKM